MDFQQEQFIKNYLQNQKLELQATFLDRKQHEGFKENLQDEVDDLVQEILQKEEAMNTLIDLANLILEKYNQGIIQKDEILQELTQKFLFLESELEFSKQTLDQYQRLYHDSQDKNQKLQEQFNKMEEQLDIFQKNEKMMNKQLDHLKNLEKKLNINEMQEITINKLNIELQDSKEANENLRNIIQDLRKKNQDLSNLQEQTLGNARQYEKQSKNFQQEIALTQAKVQDNEIKIKQYKELNEIQQQEIIQLKKQIIELENILQESRESWRQGEKRMSYFDYRKSKIEESQLNGQTLEQELNQLYGEEMEIIEYSDEEQENDKEDQIKSQKEEQQKEDQTKKEEKQQKQDLFEQQKEISMIEIIQEINDETKKEDIIKQQKTTEVQENQNIISIKKSEIGVNQNKQKEKEKGQGNQNNNKQQIKPVWNQTNLFGKIPPKTQTNNQKNRQTTFRESNQEIFKSQMQQFIKAKGKVNNKKIEEINLATSFIQKIGQYNAIRKDPMEEFFETLIKAVKLNSQYIDDVLGIDTKGWYKLVTEKEIPFHQWQKWIDDRIHKIRFELIKAREQALLYTKRVIVF